MNDWLTAKEIAELRLPGLPATKVAIAARAERENWPVKVTTGLGGQRNVYQVPTSYTEATVVRKVRNWLVNELNYDLDRIATDVRVPAGDLTYRFDLVVYSDGEKRNIEDIQIAIECKASTTDFRHESWLDRVSVLPGVRWVMVTDGQRQMVFERTVGQDGSSSWETIDALPTHATARLHALRATQRDAGMSDANLLEAIIEGVETFGAEVGDALTPQRKATLISLFYRYFREEGVVDKHKLSEMLRKVA